MSRERYSLDAPRVSIVVVTSDRCDDLRWCLRELQSHLAEGDTPAAEVLTVHAPHDTPAMAMVRADFPWVRAHRATERHLSKQRNLGAQLARGEILVYLDDDAWPRRGWLGALSGAFADDRVVAASGPVYGVDGSLQCARLAASPLGRLVPVAAEQPLPRGMSPSFPGCNLAIRRRALFDCGGFDENLCHQPDDMDVCCRLFARSGRSPDAMRYVATAAVNHESSPGPFRTLHDCAWFTVARDNTYFAFKHAGLFRAMLGAAALQLGNLGRFLGSLATRNLGPTAFLRCTGKLVAGTIAGYGKGLCHRARLPLQPLIEAPRPRDPEPGSPTGEPAQEGARCRPMQPV